ncbi:cell division protein ZapE [Canibacter zhuwentaonis]|uniref:cell division protein ZapE n=1 Tax=Canibacter zhuwentaonis TaxID=2837491 RepID=UPI0035100B3E
MFAMNLKKLKIVSRTPRVSGQQIANNLVPPPQFNSASFASYIPDTEYPSQEQARDLLRGFVSGAAAPAGQETSIFFGFLRKKKQPAQAATESAVATLPADKQGVYLDGGFGVGKTHLLAAAWHAQPGKKYFGTFIQYTVLVGALGYNGASDILRGAKLICIDEFELDDPGDTMLMTRLIKDLTATGSKFIATSNTPPNALGEGRFAAADFMREIQAMSDKFTTIRIEGKDYRQRDIEGVASVCTAAELAEVVVTAQTRGESVSYDDFQELLAHLARVHQASYAELIAGLDLIVLSDCAELTDQSAALRFVAFIDRVYDAQIPVRASGVPLNMIFGGGMLDGGYRKKYLRCMSRVNALCSA